MTGLKGKRILVVEDEAIIALTMEEFLIDQGAEVVGPVATLEDALRLAETSQLDVALLDLNLNGKRSDSLAALLASRAVPFVFASGYGQSGDICWPNVDVLHKPCQPDEIVSALIKAMAVKLETRRE